MTTGSRQSEHRVPVPSITQAMLTIGIHRCDFCGKERQVCAQINAGYSNGATLCGPDLRRLALLVEDSEADAWAALGRYEAAAEVRRAKDTVGKTVVRVGSALSRQEQRAWDFQQDGRTYSQIADLMGIGLSSVFTYVARAKKKVAAAQ